MDTRSIKVDFEKALKRIAKIKFFDWHKRDDECVGPVKAEICKKAKCNAGSDCCHLFRIMNINFCVW